ncbi:glycosyltransferase [Aliiglaciecola sp. 2_MG-2023]|uniref:glycosyltransferase n=1 Tax=unclassified Aliiglaciecola TaxID=2593648 RepID=UPI0026E30190|nr:MULTISPECIES: glycosyltransferase [unclassified Aliiglaciecola]MDO6709124.1 glycosyltransferase [Aliiglaciecola sp. 2_MG-2023]MDO6750272.1 glycosyltransferase [Aliiglaciecola sp. 1_MG-2023]
MTSQLQSNLISSIPSANSIEIYLDFVGGSKLENENQYILLLHDVCALVGKAPQFHSNRKSVTKLQPLCPYLENIEQKLLNSQQDFLIVSSIASLSYEVINRFDVIWVRITELDLTIHKSLYFRNFQSLDVKFNYNLHDLSWYETQCSIITSVYDGDLYMDAFLESTEKLDNYNRFEHFIVLPNSPGNEFPALLNYATKHQNVLFLYLNQDPGLYAVWNMAIRLSNSPYITNANVDDFRAPEHVRKLVAELDLNSDAVAAASALYISNSPNEVFSKNCDLPVWYETSEPELVDGQSIIKKLDKKLVAHNFLHCMPVWRAELHVFYGYFDEAFAGPSADWEFWMRCAQNNSKFIKQGETLGVHYKAPESYWRRKTKGTDNDYNATIMAHYIDENCQFKKTKNKTRAYQLVDELVSNVKSPLKLLDVINECCNQQYRRFLTGKNFSAVVDYILKNEFALADKFSRKIETYITDKNYILQERGGVLIDLLAQFLTELEQLKVDEKQLNGYWLCAFELQRLGYDTEAFLLAARISRLLSKHEQESLFLKRCIELDRDKFWRLFNRVYRFTKPLPQLFSDLGLSAQYFNSESFRQNQPIFYFPDYSKGNQYQRELYRSSVEAGCSVTGLNAFDELVSLTQQKEAGLLHIHWLNAIFDRVSEADLKTRSELFLQTIQKLKTQGWKVFWTVHNKYSHSSVFKVVEKSLRYRLSDLADKVLLHHPSAVPILNDWLSHSAHIEFQEHGAYPANILSQQERKKVRVRLGIEKTDVVLGFFGKIKPYKALDKLLSHLLPIVTSGKRFKVIIAGQQMCDKTKKIIALYPKQLTIIDNNFISNNVLAEYYSATDFVVLSYEDILTSGSLFQAYSYARPVIAPYLGTIPPYIVDGFNGFVYKEFDDFEHILNQVQMANLHSLHLFSQNALQSAQLIQWPR